MDTCKECEHYEKYDGLERAIYGYKAVMICHSNEYSKKYRTVSCCSQGFTPKKPEPKTTCKECEHYEPYDEGGWIMRCRHRVRIGKSSDGLYDEIRICNTRDFTPKKPKEEKKFCSNCRRSKIWDGGDKSCDTLKCSLGNSSWQPKPDDDSGELIDKLIRDTIAHKPLKSKENKMLRIKKWIRRYVMGCTVYCTAIICIALNPWVCKLWYWIVPAKFEWEGKVDNAVLPTLLPWFFTILSIATIIGAIIAFEKITTFVFGKLEK